MKNELSANSVLIDFNKRFVEAIEYLKTPRGGGIPRTEILEKIPLQPGTYDKIKKGERQVPVAVRRNAGLELHKLGISPSWLHHGTGDMLMPTYAMNDENVALENCREQLQVYRKQIKQLTAEMAALRAKSGENPGENSGNLGEPKP